MRLCEAICKGSCVLGRYPSVYGRDQSAEHLLSPIVLKEGGKLSRKLRELCIIQHVRDSAWLYTSICIQVCLHYFARSEACAEWGWRSGGDNYSTSATPSRELSSVQISGLSLELLQSIYRTHPLASGIATTRIGTQKKRFQVRHFFKASHIIINISVQVVTVGWTLHK